MDGPVLGASAMNFHKSIVRELLQEDGLLVLGKGLGLEILLVKLLLAAFLESRQLVFVLNSSPQVIYNAVLNRNFD
jgi:hypothetical protein